MKPHLSIPKTLLGLTLCPILAQAEDRPSYVQLAPGTIISSQPSDDALQVELAPAGDDESHETLRIIEIKNE